LKSTIRNTSGRDWRLAVFGVCKSIARVWLWIQQHPIDIGKGA
jgi:hypothetical protein